MQSKNDPERAQIDDQVVVHLEGFNRGAPSGCPPDNARAIAAPLKMLRPFLPAWVKELDAPSGRRVTPGCDLPFMAVTGSAT
jgi:hypothetical protein